MHTHLHTINDLFRCTRTSKLLPKYVIKNGIIWPSGQMSRSNEGHKST